MKYKAVIFDLFGTLVAVPSTRESEYILSQMAKLLLVSSTDFTRLWHDSFSKRMLGFFSTIEDNIRNICHELGANPTDPQITLATELRSNYMKQLLLTPRADTVEVLTQLKSGGIKIGLISDCSSMVLNFWNETQFASLIDVAVFSCLVGLQKPDERIYLLASDQLNIEPENCLYIGDGGSQELSGALNIGMNPVLIRIPSEYTADAYRRNSEEWDGTVISSLSEVLKLIGI